MSQRELTTVIGQVMENAAALIPFYMTIEEERIKANGNVAICIIDDEGSVYGKIFGTDKIRGRESYRVAWMKASQVWITGISTGEYERKVFNNEIDESSFGIRRPDFIGWEGGQQVRLSDGRLLSAGFSGFRSATDLEIVIKSIQQLNIGL